VGPDGERNPKIDIKGVGAEKKGVIKQEKNRANKKETKGGAKRKRTRIGTTPIVGKQSR